MKSRKNEVGKKIFPYTLKNDLQNHFTPKKTICKIVLPNRRERTLHLKKTICKIILPYRREKHLQSESDATF